MRNVILILILAFMGTACAVDDSGRAESDFGEPVMYVDGCRVAEDAETGMIQDFELGIGDSWWVSSDGTGTMVPLPGREPEGTRIDGGLCGTSQWALNVKADNLTRYGGAFGVNFYPEAIDAGKWDGISFWARRETSSSATLFVAISEKHTDESNGAAFFEDGQPFCHEMTEIASDKCDRFGVGVGLDVEWRYFEIPFTSMAQRGFGAEAPFLDVENILGLNISFETGDWNIWIDQVAFYSDK